MTPLPVLTCDGCSACCMVVGCPPGAYLSLAVTPPTQLPQWVIDSPDVGLWQRTPEEAREEVRAYAGTPVRPEGMPCVWLDQEKKRCRWYDHRPTVCRDFETGGDGCRQMRERFRSGM